MERIASNKPYHASPRQNKTTSSSSSSSPSSARSLEARVFVGNLSWDVEWQDLKDHMRQGGNVVHADVMKENGGRSKASYNIFFFLIF